MSNFDTSLKKSWSGPARPPTKAADLHDLLTLGGFPEPYFGGAEVEARRWSRDCRSRLIREDIASLERLQDLGHLELLVLRLPELVGSPLSIGEMPRSIAACDT